jgi:hypothetical protein
MQSWIHWLDRVFLTMERRIRLWPTAWLIGAGVYLLAMAYVSDEKFGAGAHGSWYMAMSETPFDVETPNSVGYRRLAPFIGYLLGFRGSRFLWFTALAAIAIPATLYLHLRSSRGFAPAAAIGLVTLIGISNVLTIHFIGMAYVDPVYYLCVMWAFLLADRSHGSLLFMGLAPLVHESTLALWPAWLLFRMAAMRSQGKPVWIPIAAGLAVLLPWISWRIIGDTLLQIPASFNFSYYFSAANMREMVRNQLPLLPLGLFWALKLGWVLALQGTRHYFLKGDYLRFTAALTLIAGVMAQALVAMDMGRLFCLAFPLIIIAAIDLHRPATAPLLTRRIWWLVILGLPLLSYYVGGRFVIPLLPWPLRTLIAE